MANQQLTLIDTPKRPGRPVTQKALAQDTAIDAQALAASSARAIRARRRRLRAGLRGKRVRHTKRALLRAQELHLANVNYSLHALNRLAEAA